MVCLTVVFAYLLATIFIDFQYKILQEVICLNKYNYYLRDTGARLFIILEGMGKYKAGDTVELWVGHPKDLTRVQIDVAKDFYYKAKKHGQAGIGAIDAEIEKNRQRITNAQQLMVDDELELSYYRDIKRKYDGDIGRMERKKGNSW